MNGITSLSHLMDGHTPVLRLISDWLGAISLCMRSLESQRGTKVVTSFLGQAGTRGRDPEPEVIRDGGGEYTHTHTRTHTHIRSVLPSTLSVMMTEFQSTRLSAKHLKCV